MSSTDNIRPENTEDLSVNDLTTTELRREKIRIQKEVDDINKKLSGKPAPSSPGAPYQAAQSPEVLQRRKRLLEQRLKQVDKKLKTIPPTTAATSAGNLSDTSQPDYGLDYTLGQNGLVTRSIPLNLDTAYLGGQSAKRAAESGYLLGSPIQNINANIQYTDATGTARMGAFKDAKDIGTITPMVQDPVLFKDSIYTEYVKRPQDVIELKKKLLTLVPSIMTGEPIDSEVTPGFLDAMATVAGAISEQNYYRRQANQNILSLAQGMDYLLERRGLEKPQVTTEKSFYSISDGDARAMLETYYADALGRRPTKDEVEKFTSVVRKRAEKKPQVVQGTRSPDGLSSETRVLQPGFGQTEAELTARRQAEAGPEFESYRLATSYYTALLRAIASPANVAEAPGA